MLNGETLRKIKNACVGIALRSKDNSFLKVVGSGFLLREGYVLTTRKVLEKSEKIARAKIDE